MDNLRKVLSIFFVMLILLSGTRFMVNAQQDDFVVEAEQRWDTYGVGGTCIPGTHNLAVLDVDGDGVNEMVTGGFSYMTTNGTRASIEAPLKIWRYDGQNLVLEKSESWSGAIWMVYGADADGDGKIEIITSGSVTNNITGTSALRFWNWDGQTLTLRGNYDNTLVSSMWVGDLNKDSVPEIATVGGLLTAGETMAQLSIWNWNGQNLNLQKEVTWGQGSNSRANSVTAADLNNDGVVEIVTAGYNNGLLNSTGQLRVWRWDGANLSMQSNADWCLVENTYASDVAGNPMGNTIVNNVKIADVDQDGIPEILTGGFTYEDANVMGQLRIWNFAGALNLEDSEEWTGYDITELKSITVNDVDGDNKVDIVASGVTAGSGGFAQNATIKEYAQLKVWSWDGQTLTLKQSKDWNVDDGVCAWQDGTADIDNDGKIEIVTVGCSYKNVLCDPNLRIWSLPTLEAPARPSYIYVSVVIAATVLIIAIAALFVLLKRKRRRID